MNDIPTAKKFCNEYLGFEEYGTDVPYFMIEFAKLHVKEALKEVLNNTENWDDCKVIPVEKVLNAYPLENIK